MKRSQFIKTFILFLSFLFIKPSVLFASINSIMLGKKPPSLLLNDFNNNKPSKNNLSKYNKLNSSIFGISANNEEEHESFCTSAKIGYTLLSDTTRGGNKSYDSWLDPYTKRITYMINPKSIFVYKWIGVRPNGHAQEVLLELIKQKKIYA